MTRNRLLTVLALCLSLTLAIAAQESRPKTFNTAPAPYSLENVPPFGSATVPPPPVIFPGQRGIQPTIIHPNPQRSFTPQRGEEHYSVPGKVQLGDGTTLSGEIHSDGPLQGVALFGSIAIPLNQIRGIDWQSRFDQEDVVADCGQAAGVHGVIRTSAIESPSQLSVRLIGPTVKLASKTASFSVELKNNGTAPASNVQLAVIWAKHMKLTEASLDHEDDLPQLTTQWRIAQLAAGETQSRQLNFTYLNDNSPLPSVRATVRSDQTAPVEQDRKATVVFVNGDSLTVAFMMPAIQLKTEWGHAAVELAKIQSIVLGTEKYKWEDTPLGRQLVPDDDQKPATGAGSFGT